MLAVALRKDAEASYSRYLLHLQVVIVCCSRHRLSVVGFAGNTVRIYMLTDYRNLLYHARDATTLDHCISLLLLFGPCIIAKLSLKNKKRRRACVIVALLAGRQ